MPRTYCVIDETGCEIECVHPDDYADAIRQRDAAIKMRDAAIEIAWDRMIEIERLQTFIRESALNKGVPASIVDAALKGTM